MKLGTQIRMSVLGSPWYNEPHDQWSTLERFEQDNYGGIEKV